MEGAPLPPGAVHVWRTFSRLHHRRASGGFGPSPITWQDLDAFIRVVRQPLAPWEIEAIEACDDAFLQAQAKAGKPGSNDEGEAS